MKVGMAMAVVIGAMAVGVAAQDGPGSTHSLATVISGRVTDGAGEPIENARVVIWRAGVSDAEYPGGLDGIRE